MSDIKSATIEIHIMARIIAKVATEALEKKLTQEGIDLTPLQFHILGMLSHHPFTIAELSRKLTLDPSTLVPTVDALERKAYLERSRDPNDRRRIPLILTEAGQKTLHVIPMISDDDPVFLALQEMGTQDADSLRALLRRMVHNLPDGETILKRIESRVSNHKNFKKACEDD